MTYPFVQAFYDYGARSGPVRAFVVHMAEGGGTVGYLSRESPRGVSVHYVIEYSGRIVQMLREDHASGSIDPGKLRTTEGPAPYGATVRKAVMGQWDRDPNAAVISCEIEGFAAAGPNDPQRAALFHLVADVRTRYPTMGLLGHRDFQDYKACPGGRIPWTILGGHGPGEADSGGDDVRYIDMSNLEGRKLLAVKAGDEWQTFDSPPFVGTFSVAQEVPVFGRVDSINGAYAVRIVTGRLKEGDRPALVMVRSSVPMGDLKDAVTVPDPDCATKIQAAVAATKASARIVFG